MKHLRKFFESSSDNADILREYFFNITDDLEDLCSFNIKQNTSNFYTITITSTIESPSEITIDSVDSINTWIEYNGNDSKILRELKSSISRLQDEDLIESFSLNRIHNGYELFVYTEIGKDDDVSEWIFVNDNCEAWIDEYRLKKYFKDRFDVVVSSASLQEEYGKYNDRYIELNINLNRNEMNDKLQQIKNALLKMEIVTADGEGDEISIFSECNCSMRGDGSNYIGFVLDEYVADFQ